MGKIYDEIGQGYDTTRKADPIILSQLNSLLDLIAENKYLDVACGTGNYTSEICKFGGDWHAFDQSDVMLYEAIKKSTLVKWSKSDVDRTDFQSNYFDGIMCSLAIHHFPNLSSAFKELSRILKPSGKIVLFTATPEQMNSYWLSEYFPKMMKNSCIQMPSIEAIKNATEPHGLVLKDTIPFFIKPELKDFFLYSGKQKPEIYLSKSVRDGISSFRNLCSSIELEHGLLRLQSDINSGVIQETIKRYTNKIGDYYLSY